MEDQRWPVIRDLFFAAIEREAGDRASWLDQVCSGDPSLRAELDSLLSAHERAATFIEAPAVIHSSPGLTEPEDATGRRIGGYRLVREIGAGGMGTVFFAVRADDAYRKEVAVKLVRGGVGSEVILSRFQQERQILASLDHPNIARLLDGGTTEDGLPYFVMEHVDGVPIDAYCEGHRLSTDDRLNLFRAVCAAVQYAHRNLVVHRDLKPSNILVTNDGTPKLLDFGIAKLVRPEDSGIEATATVARILTPEYASPEQLQGQPITTASDIYSLGVLLYLMLTGQSPYRVTRSLPHELARAVCEDEPERPSVAVTRGRETLMPASAIAGSRTTTDEPRRDRDVPPAKLQRRLKGDLDTIVLKALQKDPQRRYGSVEQFSEDIRRHLTGLPVLARHDTLAYRTRKFMRRHRLGVAAAALLLVTLVTGIVTTAWQARVAIAQRARAEQRFTDVRRLANTFMFEFHDSIQQLPGSTAARELLVKRALQYLDSLAGEATEDPTLQRELATAYEKVGDIQGDPFSASLGDAKGALVSYRKALAIRERVAPSAGSDVQRELVASYLKLGDILSVSGDWNGALRMFQDARKVTEELVAKEANNLDVGYDLSLAHMSIGDVQVEMGDLEGALASQHQALAIREKLTAASPQDRQRRGLAISHTRVADVLVRMGKMAESQTYYNQGIAIQEALVSVRPDNKGFRRDLGAMYQRAGQALVKQGEAGRAMNILQRNLTIAETEAAADPADAVARRNHAVALTNLAEAVARAGQPLEALTQYRRALQILEALSRGDPDNAQARRDLLITYNLLGDLSKRTSTLAEADTLHQKALSIAEAQIAVNPDLAQSREDLASTSQRIGRLDMQADRLKEAVAMQERALDLWKKLVAESPTNTDYQASLATLYGDLGRTYSALASDSRFAAPARAERWRQARSSYQQGLEIWLDLRKRAILPAGMLADDEIVGPDEIPDEISRCDQELAKLKQG